MDGSECDICFNVFSEEIYVPKVLECGHTVCLKCLKKNLKGQKACFTCMKPLSKALEEYPTNCILFKISTTIKEKRYLELQQTNSLRDKINLLLAKKETYRNSVEESITSLKNEITTKMEDFEMLHREQLELSDADERKQLLEEIDRLREAKKLYCIWNRKDDNRLQSSQYKNETHFLYDLVVRLQNGEKIFACENILHDGWRYGEITFSENRLNIHCLSSSTIGNDGFVVSFHNLRKCIGQNNDILPFIQIGNEKLIFTLTDDLTPETIRVIKLCTGEGGERLKGLKVEVNAHYPDTGKESESNSTESLNFNRCQIILPKSNNGLGYEHPLYKKKFYKMNKDDVILMTFKSKIKIYKVPEVKITRRFFNVVCKLQENCQIDFDAMFNERVEDSGISFSIT